MMQCVSMAASAAPIVGLVARVANVARFYNSIVDE